MLKSICYLEAKYKFNRFLKNNTYLRSTITEIENEECVQNLAEHIYKRRFGKLFKKGSKEC